MNKTMTIGNRRLLVIISITIILLLVPLIAMQFSDEVSWTVSDFVVAGVLLMGTGLLCSLVIDRVKKPVFKIAICLAILATLLVIWAELAVGIFGTPFAGS